VICNHIFVDGFGGMGDSLVCEKCGLDKYPESLGPSYMIAFLQGRIIKEDHVDYKEHFRLAVTARHERQMREDPHGSNHSL